MAPRALVTLAAALAVATVAVAAGATLRGSVLPSPAALAASSNPWEVHEAHVRRALESTTTRDNARNMLAFMEKVGL